MQSVMQEHAAVYHNSNSWQKVLPKCIAFHNIRNSDSSNANNANTHLELPRHNNQPLTKILFLKKMLHHKMPTLKNI
eukprot:1153676-Ditylum_brightwellii.AAC.1